MGMYQQYQASTVRELVEAHQQYAMAALEDLKADILSGERRLQVLRAKFAEVEAETKRHADWLLANPERP